jgi:hypothetical protein
LGKNFKKALPQWHSGIGVKQDDFKAAEQGCDAAIEKLEELERKKRRDFIQQTEKLDLL